MIITPSKLWSVASINQTFFGRGDGGRQDQKQSTPDFANNTVLLKD
jgi:hypothetical protein